MARTRILIVEDNFEEANYLRDTLTILDYVVSASVSSGEDALMSVSQSPPDVILMDILLEGAMDGIETAQRIHADFAIPIIYLTAHDEEDFLQRASMTEPFGFLLKPFSHRELRNTIEIALYKHMMEKRLQESEERYSSIFNATTDALILTDRTMSVLDANQQACRMYGYGRQELLGRHFAELAAPECRERLRQYLQEVLATHTALAWEGKNLQAAEKEFHVEIQAAPFDFHGETCVISAVRDITESKRTEEALSHYRDRLEAIVEERSAELWKTNTKLWKETEERHSTEEAFANEHNLLRATLEATADGILVVDREGRITHFNDRFCEMWQISRAALEGQDEDVLLKLVMPQLADPQGFFRAFRHVSQTQHKESDLIAFNDDRVFERVSCPLIRSDDVAVRVWSFRDISQYKRVEKELQSYREHLEELVEERTNELQTVIETVGEGITLSSDSGEFKIFNSEMEALTGYRKEEANRSDDFLSLLYPEPEERERAFWGMEELRSKKRIRDLETTIRSKDGSRKTLLISSAIVNSDDSDSFLSAYHDITHRKQAEQDLQQAKEAAEAANMAKSEFLANMSHELRTPLNAILGYTQILRRERNLTDRQRYSLEVMQRSGEHLLTLINDILDLSKIEAQKLELHIGEFHLNVFLNSIIEMAAIRARQKGIDFEFIPQDDLPVGILADEKYLRQILLNLLSNGVKFTENGKVCFRVSQRWHDMQRSCLRFEVEDTGSGISSENIRHIFQPFYQISHVLSHTEGTGLGLAISQRLVRMMGGSLEVTSTPGQGSLFWFDLTLPTLSGYSEPQSPSEQDTPIIGFHGPPLTILLADDHDTNRALLKELLCPLGFHIVEAVDGVEALQKADEFRPDLILLDLIMPKMDGFEVLRQIRNSPALHDVVVLAVSANAFEDTRRKSLEAGSNDFLAKPLKLKELLEKLCSHLKLQWKYEDSQSIETRPLRGQHESYELPEQEEVQQLFELATNGHLKKLLKHLEELRDSSPHILPFLSEIQRMAQGFQMKQMCAFLQQYVTKG